MTQWSYQSEKSIGLRRETQSTGESIETKAERLKNSCYLQLVFKNIFDNLMIEDKPGVGVVIVDIVVLYHTLILVVQISMLSEPGHASLAVCLMMREL